MRVAEGGVPPREGPAPAAQAAAATRQPRFSRALMQGLRGAYDYLGTVLVASALWIGLALLLGVGGSSLLWQAATSRGAGTVLFWLLGGVAAAGIGTGPLTAALFEHSRRLLCHDDPCWWELPRSVSRLWRRGLALAGLQMLVSLILAVDSLFFLGQRAALLRGIGASCLYPILFWWGLSILQWPLAAECPADSLWQVVKKSFLLLLDNLGYVSALTAVVLLFTAVCFVGPLGGLGLILRPLGGLGLIFLWAGSMAFIQTAALRELLPKYGLLTAPSEDRKELPP